MNAIITAATGYTEADLQPFLKSVGRVCPDTNVFLIAYRTDASHIDRLRRQYSFIEPVYVPRKFNRGGKVYRWFARYFINQDYSRCRWPARSVGRYSLNIMLERFFFALEVVQARRVSFANVLLTDSRDVVLQHNPFERVRRNLISGIEERKIRDCSMNSSWIRHVYGTSVYSDLADRRIVCCGVTLGPISEVEAYLQAMSREIWRRLPKVALIAQYDQGIHNYLIHTGRIKPELTDNQSGVIASLHYESPENIQTDPVKGLITVRGEAPAIVHQYDRHRKLVEFVRERSAR